MKISAGTRALLIQVACISLIALGCMASTRLLAGQEPILPAPATQTSILINNARIFDGISNQLRSGNLLIVRSTIKQNTLH